MGVWGGAFFDNDDAQDLVNDLSEVGMPALRSALGRELLGGIKRAAMRVSPAEIEEKVQVQLEKHQQQLARGLKVGSLLDAERVWRETFELDSKERRVWEVFRFAAALAVLRAHLGFHESVPVEVQAWIINNEKALKASANKLVTTSADVWCQIESYPDLVMETLRSSELEPWFPMITQMIRELTAVVDTQKTGARSRREPKR